MKKALTNKKHFLCRTLRFNNTKIMHLLWFLYYSPSSPVKQMTFVHFNPVELKLQVFTCKKAQMNKNHLHFNEDTRFAYSKRHVSFCLSKNGREKLTSHPLVKILPFVDSRLIDSSLPLSFIVTLQKSAQNCAQICSKRPCSFSQSTETCEMNNDHKS